MLSQELFLKNIKTLQEPVNATKCKKCKLYHTNTAYLKGSKKPYKCCTFCRSIANKKKEYNDELFVKSIAIKRGININNITKLYCIQPKYISPKIFKKFTNEKAFKFNTNCQFCNEYNEYHFAFMDKKGFIKKGKTVIAACPKCVNTLIGNKSLQSYANVCDSCNINKKTHNSDCCKNCAYSKYKKIYKKVQMLNKKQIPKPPAI